MIKSNLSVIKKNIESIAMKSEKVDNIKIIGVTKNVEPDRIIESIEAGINAIGENKVQEAIRKKTYIKQNVEWHMIGRLQSNKVKLAVKYFDLIHSIDRLSLVEELNKRAEVEKRTINGLIQVNITGEESKGGIKKKEIHSFINKIEESPFLRIKGLMTIGFFSRKPEDMRPYFAEMKSIFESIKRKKYQNTCMEYLSMGMSNDYIIAIEEGANMVRIGSSIYGER